MQHDKRATFGAEELAVVLSHYDLGVIESITAFPRGSHRSPKVGIVAGRGKFLLKRRLVEHIRFDRLRLAHLLVRHLIAASFPAPALMPARPHGRDYLRIKDHIYEVFEFVRGQPCRPEECGEPEAREAGRLLARFHRCAQDFEPGFEPDTGLRRSYHDSSAVRTGLCSIGSTLSSHDSFSGDEVELAALVQTVLSAYDGAAKGANGAGFLEAPERLVHADWHPGNLMFRNGSVVAVIDFDGVRLARRVTDVANGALQFSMIAGGDPSTWAEHVDEDRFRGFLEGYRSIEPLTEAETRCVPFLMVEALTAECVPPITETGSVGRWAGFRVLQMIARKGAWIMGNAERLSAMCGA